jgi:ABC-2 type transport system permease protein
MTVSAIIKSELYKLKKSKLFFMCALVCAALAVFFVYSVQVSIRTRAGESREVIADMLSRVSVIAMLEDFLPLPFIPAIFAVFVSLFVSGEFHHGTIKNYVSKGVNRVHLYLSKLAVSGLAVLMLFAAAIGAFCIMGAILFRFDSTGMATAANVTAMLLSESLLMLAYTSLFVFFSLWLRNSAAAVVANIAMVNFMNTALLMISYAIGGDVMLSDYWIAGNIASLATLFPESGTLSRGLIVGLCYLAGGTLLGSILFRNQDIK